MFGVRHTDNPEVRNLAAEVGAQVGSIEEAIAFGDVVVFAIPGRVMAETIRTHGQALAGKIVVDTANRLEEAVSNSAADFVAHAPGVRIFRAFNSIAWENFENPQFGDVQADLFYCGPDGEARVQVEQLISDVGMRPVRVGDVDQVEVVDAVLRLFFALARGQNRGRHLAFKMLTR
jgi:predicted dinucleotide-binding enzyme